MSKPTQKDALTISTLKFCCSGRSATTQLAGEFVKGQSTGNSRKHRHGIRRLCCSHKKNPELNAFVVKVSVRHNQILGTIARFFNLTRCTARLVDSKQNCTSLCLSSVVIQQKQKVLLITLHNWSDQCGKSSLKEGVPVQGLFSTTSTVQCVSLGSSLV